MSSLKKTHKTLKEAAQAEEKSMYPTREQFACVRCKDKVFTSWNDFENHHAKHAVDFTFSQLPVVKLQRIQIPCLKSGTQNPSSSANRNIDTISPNLNLSECSKNTLFDTKESNSSENKSIEQEELLTWPGSCESSTPVASPLSTPVCASNEIVPPVCTLVCAPNEVVSLVSTVTVESQIDPNVLDPNVLDPAFIEKLGEEISFLNQSLLDPVIRAVQKESLTEIVQPVDVNLVGSSSSSTDPQAPSVNIPLVEPIFPPTPTTEKSLAPAQPLAETPEDKLVGTNENDTLSSENESIPSSKEIELPKSKGQLRLVPFESLLSPSRLPVDRVEEEVAPINSTPISPSKNQNRQHAMVVIPERNLMDLNIPGQAASIAISESLSSSGIKDPTHQQQVWQMSQPNIPPAVIRTMLPNPIPSILPLPQQQIATPVYQFHHAAGQVQHQPQLYQHLQQHHHQQQPQQQPQQQRQQLRQQQQQQKQQQKMQASNLLQYQPQQQPAYRQQMITGQQQGQYVAAPQYVQRFPNQQGMAYPSQSYPGPSRANQHNDFVRPSVSSAMAFASSHGSAQVHSVSTASYLQQNMSNPIQSVQSSSHTRYQFPNNSGIYNSTLHNTNISVPHYRDRPSAPIVHHVQLQIPTVPSSRTSCSTAQTNVRQQAVVPPGQPVLRHALASAPKISVRPQQAIQQCGGYVFMLPQPSNTLDSVGSLATTPQVAPNSQSSVTTLPSTSTASVATSSATRLPPPSYSGQQISSAPNQPVTQKRPLTTEGAIPVVCQPPRKVARIEEEATVSTSQSSGDCEVSIVQKKQTGLPVIQSVEGGGNSVVTKPSSQVLQTPSVASLLSNPNITVTPAKNKENQTASETTAALKAPSALTSTVNSNTRTPRPITIDLTNSSSASPQQRNPLQCQVCNEMFSSQSLLKNHLVLHLRRVHPGTVRPTSSPPVARNLVANQPLAVNCPSSRTYPGSQKGRANETVTPGTSGCVSVTNNSAITKQGPHPLSAKRPMMEYPWVSDAEASSSSLIMNPVSNQELAVDSPTSRTKTVGNLAGQTSGLSPASTSDYAFITSKQMTIRQGSQSPVIVKTTADADDDAINDSQQSKGGGPLGSGKQNRPANVTTQHATSPGQCCSQNESRSRPMDKATSSGSEFYIPIVDLKRQDVITQLESMGINQFIPASNLTSCTNHKDFAIPIMSAAAIRRGGTTAFPSLSGVINLGSPKLFPSTSN